MDEDEFRGQVSQDSMEDEMSTMKDGAGKAANAGGVATSGLEMSQNAMGLSWSFEEVDEKLKGIMKNIFNNIDSANKKFGIRNNDLLTCANIVGFIKLSEAMIAQGVI